MFVYTGFWFIQGFVYRGFTVQQNENTFRKIYFSGKGSLNFKFLLVFFYWYFSTCYLSFVDLIGYLYITSWALNLISTFFINTETKIFAKPLISLQTVNRTMSVTEDW